jgi:pSer/pThr/pTyr-binding forkhead associated (FHA) protein
VGENSEKEKRMLSSTQETPIDPTIIRNTYLLPPACKLKIGRSKKADVCINDRYMSGEHGIFRSSNQHVYLEDLKSSNGTYVNRKKIFVPVKLKNNDLIIMGQTVIFFYSLEPFRHTDPE